MKCILAVAILILGGAGTAVAQDGGYLISHPRSMTEPAAPLSPHQSKCLSYGAQPGTDAYVNCMMTLDKMDAEALASARAAQAADEADRRARSAALLMQGLRILSPPPPKMNTAQCTRFGNTVNCIGTSQ